MKYMAYLKVVDGGKEFCFRAEGTDLKELMKEVSSWVGRHSKKDEEIVPKNLTEEQQKWLKEMFGGW